MDNNDHEIDPEGEFGGGWHCMHCRLPIELESSKNAREMKWRHLVQNYPTSLEQTGTR